MSQYQRGRNIGVTGLIDLPGFSAKFEVKIFRYKARLSGQTRERRGRGGGVFKTVRWVFSSGTIACTGKSIITGWPLPDAWKGQTGTITVQVATGRTVTYPVVVLDAQWDLTGAKDSQPKIALACELTAAPTFAGWSGTQPAATDPSKENQEQWQGTSKVYDPSGLLTQATRLIDVWGTLDDTDAAEQTLIVSTISSSTPFTTPHNLKLRTRSFQRDAIDGGTVTEVWGLTTVEEDWVNSRTRTSVDAGAVARSETTAGFGSAPSAATSGLVARHLHTQEVNDSKIGKVQEYGERTPTQDITFPGTPTTTDKSTIPIQSRRSETQVTSASTEPSFTPGGALKTRTWNKQQHTDAGKYIHRHDAGLTTPQEDLENQSSQTYVCPSGLKDRTVRGLVLATATTADPSAAPSGQVLYGTPTTEVHDNGFLRRFDYRLLTPEQEIEHAGTHSTSDVGRPATSGIIVSETLLDTCASGDDAQELALAAMTTYGNVAGFDSIITRKRNTTHFDLILKKIADDKMIICSQPTARMERLGLDGYNRTAVKLQDVVSVVSGGSPVNDVLIGYFGWTVAYQMVILWRRKTGIDNLSDMLSLSARGYTNNASFLGYSTGTLMFQGTLIPKANWNNEGTNYTHSFAYVFAYKSIGHGDDGSVPVGRWVRTAYNTGVTPGATPLAANIKSGWAVNAPGTADFSGFLS